MHPLLQQTAHRLWPPPTGPWVMTQTWHDLLFAHWPLPPRVLRPLVPAQLPLDTYDGQCWLAVTPFHMSKVRPRGVPAVPGFSRFPELNVRTYVKLADKPGDNRPQRISGRDSSPAMAAAGRRGRTRDQYYGCGRRDQAAGSCAAAALLAAGGGAGVAFAAGVTGQGTP